MTRRDPMVHVRMPEDLKDLLTHNAKVNRRSLNSEIVFGLEFYARSIEQTEKASDTALGKQSDAPQN